MHGPYNVKNYEENSQTNTMDRKARMLPVNELMFDYTITDIIVHSFYCLLLNF